MTNIADGNVEILVHIGAPSSGRDDARYRALAKAYLNFEVADQLDLLEINDEGLGISTEGLSGPETEWDSAASYKPEEEQEPDEDTCRSSQHAFDRVKGSDRFTRSKYMDSPSASFRSVLDNADSPAFKLATSRAAAAPLDGSLSQGNNSFDSWIPPPSEVADSQPELGQTDQAQTSPAEVLALYLQRQQEDILSNNQQYQFAGQQLQGKRAAITQSKHNSKPSNTTATSINRPEGTPVTGLSNHQEQIRTPISATTTVMLEEDSDRQQVSAAESLQAKESDAPNNEEKSATTIEDTTARKRSHDEMAPLEPTSSAAQRTLQRSTMRRDQPIPSLKWDPIWETRTEIRPPPPPTGHGDIPLSALVTKDLQFFADHMPLDKHFRPALQLRELRYMERGHWRLDTSVWSRELQVRCWKFLGEFVGKSRGGWTLKCERAEDYSWLRCYCYGSAVGHIYLLLYVASENKIRFAKARWMGGELGSQVMIAMDQSEE